MHPGGDGDPGRSLPCKVRRDERIHTQPPAHKQDTEEDCDICLVKYGARVKTLKCVLFHSSNFSEICVCLYTGTSWFIHGLKAVVIAVVIISLSGIWIYFTWKKKTILEGSAVPQRMESPDNSVLMTEMSPYSNT